MPSSDRVTPLGDQAKGSTDNSVGSPEPLRTDLQRLLFQLADSDVLLDPLNESIKAGEDVELSKVALDLLVHARMIEGVVRHDASSSWSDKRQARALLLNSFLGAVSIMASYKK